MGATKKTIAVDIDDVLSTNVKDFVAYCNQKWGTNLTVDDYDEDWDRLWGVDREETLRRSKIYHDSGVIGNYGHIEESIPVLKQLKKNFRLVIVTSRRKVLMKETTDWLNNYFQGVFEEVHYAGIWDGDPENAIHGTKAELCAQIGADYLVDDQPKHCIAAAEAGIDALLFGNYGWNRGVQLPVNVTRVNDWSEVLEYFDGRSL